MLQRTELNLLVCDLNNQYGYDFTDFSEAVFLHQVNSFISQHKLAAFAEFHERIMNDTAFFNSFVEVMTINARELFHHPEFCRFVRQEVLPQLKLLPIIRIWDAGCSTGEDVFSMAILLQEAGLLERSLVYATDLNQHALNMASSASFPVRMLEKYEENYKLAGGSGKLSDYYSITGDAAVFSEALRNRMVFSPHNLAANESFNQFNFICCGNLMINLSESQQNRVLKRVSDSIVQGGFLVIGLPEQTHFSAIANDYEAAGKQFNVWRKK